METPQSSLGTLAARWGGQFKMPAPDPDDARLNFLLEKYYRNAPEAYAAYILEHPEAPAILGLPAPTPGQPGGPDEGIREP